MDFRSILCLQILFVRKVVSDILMQLVKVIVILLNISYKHMLMGDRQGYLALQ